MSKDAGALKLYVAAGSPLCDLVEIVAHEKKVAYERVVVGLREEMPQWYKEVNPRETVPMLVVGQRRQVVLESTLIARYVDNISTPAGSLMGTSPLQRHRIEFFLSQVGDFTGAAHDLLRDPLNGEKRKAVEDNAAYVDGLLAANQTTGPYYFDAEFTMADVALVPFLVRLKPAMMYYAGYDVFSKAPHIKALWAAAVQRPSVRETAPTPEQCVEGYRHMVPENAPAMGANGGYVLYGNRLCPFVDRARLACALRRFTPYFVEVALHPQPEWYKYINYRETVPALFTPGGEAVHESQLIANYVDSVATEGAALLPRGDADKEYEVAFFVDNASSFVASMYWFTSNPENNEAKGDLLWAAGELEKQLAKHPFGEGPFFGGAQMNLGDVALLPFLVRTKAFTPELTGGYNLFSEFPLLGKLVEAGLASPEGKEVFAPLKVYLENTKARRAKQH